MYDDIVKVRREGNNLLIFTSKGLLLSLNKKEAEIFKKFGDKEQIEIKHKEILSKLASYGILKFKNFSPKQLEKEYDLSLMKHNSSSPVYPAPILAHLAITNKCNMKCKYCSVRKLHSFYPKELDTDSWKRIISKLADWGVFQIGFTGGEPTLRKDLPELIEFTHECGCVCNITTNGWFLNKELVSKLVNAGLKQCQVSLDCHIPKIHNELRGNGSHKRVIKAIKLLREGGISVGIDCVVSKKNIKFIKKFIRWCYKNKIPYITLIKLKMGDLSKEDYSQLSLDYFEYSNLIKFVCKRKENSNPNITLDCGSISNLQAVTYKEKFSTIPVSGCPLGHYLICSSPNGDIYPCAALLNEKFRMGNLLTDNLRLMWEKSPLLKELRLIKKKIKGKCKNCERLDLCRGGCRGIAYCLSNNLFESDASCRFENIQEVKNESKS